MEYQFVRDPIFGFRAKFTDEQALFGRWLTEEINTDRQQLTALLGLIEQVKAVQVNELKLLGKEVSLTLSDAEALLEANILHQGDEDISMYQDDALALDEDGLLAVCGYEDFVALIHAWCEFIRFNITP